MTATSAAGTQRDRRSRGGEIAVASVLFVFACIQFLSLTLGSGSQPPHGVSSAPFLFSFLALGYLGLSIRDARRWLRSLFSGPVATTIAGPAVLLCAVTAYARTEGLPVEPRALGYGAYLFVPAILLALGHLTARTRPARELVAAAALWLPIEFHLLPALPLPLPDAYDAGRLVGIVAAFYLFLVARPIGGIGYTFLLEGRDFRLAGAAVAGYAMVGLPLGLVSGFLAWHPHANAMSFFLTPESIYLVTAVPEEFLFRGLIQNLCTRSLGPRLGLAIASVVFGLAHLPDPRYVALATLAGGMYGWVYARTGKITASAVTHAGVDWIWGLAFRR